MLESVLRSAFCFAITLLGVSTIKRAVSLRWHSTCVFLDAIVSWPRLAATITTSRFWVVSTLRLSFVDDSCSHCGYMTIAMLRSRLQYLEKGGVLSAISRSGCSTHGDLRIIVLRTLSASELMRTAGQRRSSTSCPFACPSPRTSLCGIYNRSGAAQA